MITLRDRLKQPRPLVVAHRGNFSATPENSRAAIAAARACDMVEIDVRLSADGVPVVMHDETLERTTGRPEAVVDVTSADLTRIHLLDSDETVPKLADVLNAGPKPLFFDIDVKRDEDLDRVAAFLRQCPERHRVMLKHNVHDTTSLKALCDLEARHGIPVIAKVRLASDKDIALIRALQEAEVAAAEVWFASAELLAAACNTGLPISVYTLDEIACDGFSDYAAQEDPAAIWGRLIEIGGRLIMTDHPADLQRYLCEECSISPYMMWSADLSA